MMKIHKYNKNTLTYKEHNIIPYGIIVFILLISTFFLGVKRGRMIKINNLTNYEKELIVLNIDDTLSDFSEKKLIILMKELNIKFPHIAIAQAKIESANYTSRIYRENNNLFGMKEANVRIHTAQGTQYNHAYYNTWRESVYDYAFYQSRYLSGIKTEEEYLRYLGKSYAESPDYINALKSKIKDENLKSLFSGNK